MAVEKIVSVESTGSGWVEVLGAAGLTKGAKGIGGGARCKDSVRPINTRLSSDLANMCTDAFPAAHRLQK